MKDIDYEQTADCLKQGGVIAYPTEAVFGLGCDPWNEVAVNRVFAMKHRPKDKGLIVIAADFSQIKDLIIPTRHMEKIMASWPGPFTWVFSVTEKVPGWLLGNFNALAVRVTAHPVASAICKAFGGPIVSTSANVSTKPPATSFEMLDPMLTPSIDKIIPAKVGSEAQCSTITDARTLAVIR